MFIHPQLCVSRIIPFNKITPEIPHAEKDIRNIASTPIIITMIELLIKDDVKRICKIHSNVNQNCQAGFQS